MSPSIGGYRRDSGELIASLHSLKIKGFLWKDHPKPASPFGGIRCTNRIWPVWQRCRSNWGTRNLSTRLDISNGLDLPVREFLGDSFALIEA
jgi:hypothetical protein